MTKNKVSTVKHSSEVLENIKNPMGSLSLEATNSISNEFKRILAPVVNSTARAREVIDLFDKNLDNSLPDVIDEIQAVLDSKGQLTAIQILFLILEARGFDTSRFGKELGAKGGKNKTGFVNPLHRALLEVVKIIRSTTYRDVAKYLNNSGNWELVDEIIIKACNLPLKQGAGGTLTYETLKEEKKTAAFTTIDYHLKNIRKLNKSEE